MWESSALPAAWAARAEPGARADRADALRGARVSREWRTCPIVVIPEGIDPAVYSFGTPGPTLTTLIVGTVGSASTSREGIAAWKRAFASDPTRG